MAVGGALATVEGVWALFNQDPLVPTVYNLAASVLPNVARPLALFVWGLVLVGGLALVVGLRRASPPEPITPLPAITVTPVVGEGRAVLAVHNSGAGGDLTAHGRVLDEIGKRGATGYIAYWEGNHGRTCHIDQDGDAEILLGRIAEESSGATVSDAIYRDGLMLYRMGSDGNEQPFGAYRIIRTDLPDGGIAGRAEDACTVEITITSTPPLRTPWGAHQYELSASGGDMRLTEVIPARGPQKIKNLAGEGLPE